MKILRIGPGQDLVVLLFGIGLIGGAVNRALHLRFAAEAQDFDYEWRDPALRQAQQGAILTALPESGRIAVVWTGGQSGFGATEEEMAQETTILAELVGIAETLARHGRKVDFHMLSSAGGLFESQRHCDRASRPLPLRPYGEGKFRQEETLMRASGIGRRQIYRPSSVYGVTKSHRTGLVTALISNAMRGGTTRISGNPNTLRDYVLVDDIGHFIARKIVEPDVAARQTYLLASGRSASVFEVIERIRERMERPLLLQFDPHPQNSRDMSFMPSALPRDWQATSLASGISRIVTFFRSGSD